MVKSRSYRRRCKYGVNKRTKKCLKSPRRKRSTKKRSYRRSYRRPRRSLRSRSPLKRRLCNYKRGDIHYTNCEDGKFNCDKIKNSTFKAIQNDDFTTVQIQRCLAKKYKCKLQRRPSQVSRDAFTNLFGSEQEIPQSCPF